MPLAPFTIDTGALGLEAVWTCNGLELNDQTAKPEWIALQRITGLFDGPDHEAPADKRVGRPGENFRPASAGGKTVVLEGEVRSQSLYGLRALSTSLRAAFAPAPALSAMSIEANPAIGGPAAVFFARPVALTMDDAQTTASWRRPFSLSLRLSDPRVYFLDLTVNVVNTSGAATVTNVGNAPADPLVRVVGASGTVVISDGTHTLTFLAVPSGTLEVDFAKRTAKVGTVNAQLDPTNSDWWDSFTDGIAPGATVSVSQTGGNSVRVIFTPADW